MVVARASVVVAMGLPVNVTKINASAQVDAV